MNATFQKKHTMNWAKFTLPEWLYQFGAWQGAMRIKGGGTTLLNPLFNVIKEARVKLKQCDSDLAIALYFCSEDYDLPKTPKKMPCLITDEEAQEVQQLVVGIIRWANTNKSWAQLEWMDAIIDRYFNQRSWSEMENSNRTGMDAKYDVRCGLAVLHHHYPFIQYTNGVV